MAQSHLTLWERSILAAYRLGARTVFENPDQGEWIFERIRRPGTALTAAMNLLFYKLKVPRIWGAVTLQLEPTFGCNLQCKYCWGSGTVTAERQHFMGQEVFRATADHLPDTVESVAFSLIGEPLLNPNLGNMIEHVHRKGRRVILFTNGTRLTGERLKMVARSHLSVVNVSIEPDRETALENRGIELDRIRANVRELHRIKRPELQIKASCVITPNNIDRLDKIRGYWDGLISEFKFAPCFYISANAPISMCLEAWRGNFNILTSGDVSPCCFDGNADLIIGNVLESKLSDIANGPRMRKMLADMVNRNPPGRCLNCNQFETSVAPLRVPKDT
jgi:radical SAM protein with 4Fe4S-binding SPASM domain